MAKFQQHHEMDESSQVIILFAREFHRNFAQIAMMQGRHSPAECPYCNVSSLDPNARFCDLCDPMLYPFDKMPAASKQQFIAGVAGVFALGVQHFEMGDDKFWREVLMSAAPALAALVVTPNEDAARELARLRSDPRVVAALEAPVVDPDVDVSAEMAKLDALQVEAATEAHDDAYMAEEQASVGDPVLAVHHAAAVDMLSKVGSHNLTSDPGLVGSEDEE